MTEKEVELLKSLRAAHAKLDDASRAQARVVDDIENEVEAVKHRAREARKHEVEAAQKVVADARGELGVALAIARAHYGVGHDFAPVKGRFGRVTSVCSCGWKERRPREVPANDARGTWLNHVDDVVAIALGAAKPDPKDPWCQPRRFLTRGGSEP